jgi:hypothetical protein
MPDRRPPWRRRLIPALRAHRAGAGWGAAFAPSGQGLTEQAPHVRAPRLSDSSRREIRRLATAGAGRPQVLPVKPSRKGHHAEGGPRATPEDKSPIYTLNRLTTKVTSTILTANANRAPHHRSCFPIPPRGWCAPRPPPRRRGAQRHCPRHHTHPRPAAPSHLANQPRPRRGARSASPRAQAATFSAPVAHPVHLSRSAGEVAREAGG